MKHEAGANFDKTLIYFDLPKDRRKQIRTSNTSEPAATRVLYKQGPGAGDYVAGTTLDENLTTHHAVVITDFLPATVYQFRLQAQDASGNLASSQDYTVLVLAEKKSVIQMIVENLENTFGWLKKITDS